MQHPRKHIRLAVIGAISMLAAVMAAAAPAAAQDAVLCFGQEATIVADGPGKLLGTAGDDVMVGSDGSDIILGRGGNDIICGGAGNDRIFGGGGDDLIDGESGGDIIRGGDGSDKLRGSGGRDVLRGGPKADRLNGGGAPDRLFGGPGNDTLRGGNGADLLSGDDGRNDLLDGGTARDTCLDGQSTTRFRFCEAGDIPADFELSILHINDHHSHLDDDSGDLDFDGEGTRVRLGGFPSVVTKMDELVAAHEGDNVVKIHAGDALTGTLFFSLFDGEADAALMNEVCFDIFELGNHEFDSGDAGLKTFLDFLAAGDCETEVIAANVVPQVGTPLAPNAVDDYIAPNTVITYGDDMVGYVGLNIANKTQNSSSPLETTQFLDEVETAQAQIDALAAQGVDKIVLVTHIQLDNDIDLASMVSGVDVIVGGDSHSLLGDFGDFGLNTSGEYPYRTTDADGKDVCIVHAWQYSWVVGELNVGWDAAGDILRCEGTPHLILADSFQRRPEPDADRAELEGAERQAVINIINSTPELSIVEPDADAQTVLDGFSEQVAELEQTVIGTATEDLCLERIPGQGRSLICDVEDTAVMGGDIQQLVTEAFRTRSFESDIAIQNSGGVRIDIPQGEITIADAYELLPFANTIVNLEMSGAEIKAVLEDAIDFAIQPDGSTGAYPYAAGLRWDVDLTKAKGERVSNLEIRRLLDRSWTPFSIEGTYLVATNSFVANGGDSYDTFEAVVDDGRSVDTFLDYAQSFIDYVEQDLGGTISKLDASEYSTQSFIPAEEP